MTTEDGKQMKLDLATAPKIEGDHKVTPGAGHITIGFSGPIGSPEFRPMVTINPDGTIKFHDGFVLSETVKAFWTAIGAARTKLHEYFQPCGECGGMGSIPVKTEDFEKPGDSFGFFSKKDPTDGR